ncbi:MAG: hypothetical protein K2X98_01985 [Alphaproteobacteria bacterium]|nr:hypothetical protein [Alphaproteobacteria bacterium]
MIYTIRIILSLMVCCISNLSAMDSPSETQQSQQRIEALTSHIARVKKYIEGLENSGIAPQLVFGVNAGEEGVDRFDKSWIFVDLDQPKANNRALALSFNSVDELVALAKNFPNTFHTIAFDAEVPTYLKRFGLHHLKAIHGALKMGGSFWLPWQYCMEADYQNSDKWSGMTAEKVINDFVEISHLMDHHDLLDPVLRLPKINGTWDINENTAPVQKKIVDEIRNKNQIPLLEKIFGYGNVDILTKRRLPFPENEGRLSNPPYVSVFVGKKVSPTENITIPAIQPVIPEMSFENAPRQTLPEQIQHLRADSSTSLVVVVDVNEKPERFNNTWIQVDRNRTSTNSHVLKSSLSLEDLKVLAEQCPNKFQTIVFDVETPSLFIKEWSPEHFSLLHQTIKPSGTLVLPIHYDWAMPQGHIDQSLAEFENELSQKLNLDKMDRLIFEGIPIPQIFKSQYGKNDDIEHIMGQLILVRALSDDVYTEGKLTEFNIKRINSGLTYFFNAGYTKIKLSLDDSLINVINANLHDFLYKKEDLGMKNAIEDHLLTHERHAFKKHFLKKRLIPHTVSFLENIFGKGQIFVGFDKKMPFEDIRSQMDYVIFTATKEK